MKRWKGWLLNLLEKAAASFKCFTLDWTFVYFIEMLHIDTNLKLMLLKHTVHIFQILFKVLYLCNSFNNVSKISSPWKLLLPAI